MSKSVSPTVKSNYDPAKLHNLPIQNALVTSRIFKTHALPVKHRTSSQRLFSKLPNELLLEIFTYCDFQDRYSFCQVCQRWAVLADAILHYKSYQLPGCRHRLEKCKEVEVYHPHAIFPSIRLFRTFGSTPGSGLGVKFNTLLMNPWTLSLKPLSKLPVRCDPATYPPLDKMNLRLQFQPKVGEKAVMRENWKARYEICVEGMEGKDVCVGDVCEALRKRFGLDRHLTEWKIWVGEMRWEGGVDFVVDWTTYTC